MSIKPMHQTGAFVLKEFVVFIRLRFLATISLLGDP